MKKDKNPKKNKSVNIDKKKKDYIEDGFGSAWGSKCPECGGKMEVVRPGKVQCGRCG